ncbi:protein of unknown function (plasmid) [Caballeronia sp. S22]
MLGSRLYRLVSSRRRTLKRNGYANDWPVKCNHFAIKQNELACATRKIFVQANPGGLSLSYAGASHERCAHTFSAAVPVRGA